MTTQHPRPSPDPSANAEHAWTLVRWIGIPLILVGAIYLVQRTLDERPRVVSMQGPMMSPEEMASAHPIKPQVPQAPATGAPVPLHPVAPAGEATTATPPPDALPQPLSQPSPTYPQRALEEEKEGVVRLRLSITPDGRVAAAEILRSSPSGWFERAAKEAVSRWRYTPSEFGGTTEVDVEFKLN